MIIQLDDDLFAKQRQHNNACSRVVRPTHRLVRPKVESIIVVDPPALQLLIRE
jgi:hypothetical protein